MPPLVAHLNLMGWISLGGLYLGLALVTLAALNLRGVRLRELDGQTRLFLAAGVFVAGLFVCRRGDSPLRSHPAGAVPTAWLPVLPVGALTAVRLRSISAFG